MQVKLIPYLRLSLQNPKNIKVYSIGIGDKKGAPIPIFHPTYGKRYARHPNGQLVLTQFDDAVLKEISQITNGKYFNATNTEELKNIYKEINQLEKTLINTAKNYIVIDIFPYLIANYWFACCKRINIIYLFSGSRNIMFANLEAGWLFLLIPVLISLYYFRFKDRKIIWQGFQSDKNWINGIQLSGANFFFWKKTLPILPCVF